MLRKNSINCKKYLKILWVISKIGKVSLNIVLFILKIIS